MSVIKLNPLSKVEILDYIPQQIPFRFVDEILFVDENNISGTYQFKVDEYFYQGHFPEKPVTPGVILLETMCQIGLVSHAIYLRSMECSRDTLKKGITFFTDTEVEFFKPVDPGEKIVVHAKKIFWRRMKLRSKVEMYDQTNQLIASAVASGMGVSK